MPASHQPKNPPFGATLLAILLTLAVLSPMASPAQAADTSTRWDTFSESSSCGDPFTRTPFASKTGWLSDSEPILGPFGTYFGRSISEVRTRLRYWNVPYSSGLRVRVHEAMLPDLEKVTEALAANAAAGRIYQISSAGAFTPRTIGGRYHISRHAMGTAIDLNPAQNPYRSDGKLITDMPDWFVESWRQAGFCWGGDWRGSKDPMHFSWMGPGATASSAGILEPDPPDTTKTTFHGPVAEYQTEFGPVMSQYLFAIGDANSNGTSDVLGLRPHSNGSVVDIGLGSLGYENCSIGRWFIPDTTMSSADHLLSADVDGDSGEDLIALLASGSSLETRWASRRTGFETITTTTTGAGADAVALNSADFDGNRRADLWEATPDGDLRIWEGPGFTDLLSQASLPNGPPVLLAGGDRDGGDTPELFALYPSGGATRLDVLHYAGGWTTETSLSLSTPAETIRAIGANDFDGDGRADAELLTGKGHLLAYIGNSSTGSPITRWFMYRDPECEDPILLQYAGSFMDDDSSIFAANIESIAAVGVTKGCNPPFNDKFCPDDDVTREQMAAFLVRALGLTANSHPGFDDVPAGSTFATDIGKLATAGITKGCNPPDNTEYCPEAHVTREQMAAFLTRSLGLVGNTHSGFVDVAADNTFALDIGKLATAAITKGCNPPANDRFCPGETVTRGQMAAFLDRAGLGS